MNKGLGIFTDILFAALMVFSYFALNVAVVVICMACGVPEENEGIMYLLLTVLAICVAMVIALPKKKRGIKVIQIKKPLAREVLLAIVIGIGLLGLTTVYFLLADFLAEVFSEAGSDVLSDAISDYETVNSVEDEYIAPMYDVILSLFVTSLLIPISEEVWFRGLAYHYSSRRMPYGLAAVIVALMFGIMHMQPIQIGYAFFSGIILVFVYIFTENIICSIIAHASFNILGSTFVQVFQSDAFGISEDVSDIVLTQLVLIELSMIIPAIAAFIYLANRWNKKRKEAKLVTAQELEAEVTA